VALRVAVGSNVAVAGLNVALGLGIEVAVAADVAVLRVLVEEGSGACASTTT
jgi:hypothetical protein